MDLDMINKLLPVMFEGLKITLNVFWMTLVFSIPFGFILALLKRSKIKAVNWIVSTYIWLLRGTPLMLQLFFVYYGLPYFGKTFGLPETIIFDVNMFGINMQWQIGTSIVFPPFTAAIIAFTMNYGAYFAEIFRAGIESIDKGQFESAKALGYTYWQTMGKIIMPQMVRLTLPPVSNETITLVKDTALITAVSLVDLMRATQLRVADMANIAPFGVAAVFYLVLTLIITIGFRYLEKRFCRY